MGKFYVTGISGDMYSDPIHWSDAEDLARKDSEDGEVRIIEDLATQKIAALFYDGERYLPAAGHTCEQCGKPLDEEAAAYAYDLTGHFFCGSTCGVDLGVLIEPTNKPR